jgi:hypothetical protein
MSVPEADLQELRMNLEMKTLQPKQQQQQMHLMIIETWAFDSDNVPSPFS